jgi:hypothetical protein
VRQTERTVSERDRGGTTIGSHRSFRAFIETVASVQERYAQSGRPSSVLNTRSSKRSLMQASPIPTRCMTTVSTKITVATNRDVTERDSFLFADSPIATLPSRPGLRTSSVPVFTSRGVLGFQDSGDISDGATSRQTIRVRTPYSRRIPSATTKQRHHILDASTAPPSEPTPLLQRAMLHENILTRKHPGVSGVTQLVHPLLNIHAKLAREFHVGFGSNEGDEASRSVPRRVHEENDPATTQSVPAKSVAQQNALATSFMFGVVTPPSRPPSSSCAGGVLHAPQLQSAEISHVCTRQAVTPPPFPPSRSYVEFPEGRSATPNPTTTGMNASYLTTVGWRHNAVEVVPVPGAKRTLPSLSSHVVARCNVTPNKTKDPDCSALPRPQSSSATGMAVLGGRRQR